MRKLFLALALIFSATVSADQKVYITDQIVSVQKDCLVVAMENGYALADSLEKDDEGFFIVPSCWYERDGTWTCGICGVNYPSRPWVCPTCKDN